jgi:hypothetical protein
MEHNAESQRSRTMPTDASLRALREANPRHQPGFDELLASYDALRTQITATPVVSPRRLPQLAGRRRLIGLSAAVAAALVAAGVLVGLTMTAASPPSAYAAAKKALAATSAATSGTMTMTVLHDDATYTLDTTRWNGNDIAISSGQRSQLGPNQQLLIIGGSAYAQTADGSWLHFAPVSDPWPKLGPFVQLAQDNVAGNTAEQILALATGLQKTVQPDGTTVYTGTIPNSNADSGIAPTDGVIMRMIVNLRNGNELNLRNGNEPGTPGGYHNDLQLQMTVGSDGLVRQVSLTFQQQDTKSPTGDGTYTWSVTYSHLGSTPPITAPATFTEATAPAPFTETMSGAAPTDTTTVPTPTTTAP